MSDEPESGPEAGTDAPDGVRQAGRPPGWLLYARIAAVLVVAVVVAASVVLLRKQQPRTMALHNGASQATGDAAAAQPAATPDDRPLGVLESGAPTVGKPAPDFALLDLEGHRVELADLRGKAVVLNFWATWCGPCRQEFPELQKVAAGMSSDVVVLALDQAESAARVAQYRDEFQATFTILLDARTQVADAYRLSGIPDTIFIDKNGIVRDVVFGPLSAGTFRYKINQTLKER